MDVIQKRNIALAVTLAGLSEIKMTNEKKVLGEELQATLWSPTLDTRPA
jgi:hypothetical protein